MRVCMYACMYVYMRAFVFMTCIILVPSCMYVKRFFFGFLISIFFFDIFLSFLILRKMLESKSQVEKDKVSTATMIKRSDIFGESAGGAGLDDQKVKEVKNMLYHLKIFFSHFSYILHIF